MTRSFDWSPIALRRGTPTWPPSPGNSRPNCPRPRSPARWSAGASTITRSIRRCRPEVASSTRSTTSSRSASWLAMCANAMRRWASCTPCGRRCRAGSRITSRSPDTVSTSRCTPVIGPEGKPLEVQIRTYDMHHTAEYGIASHWRYKESRGTHSGVATSVDEMAWMRQLLDWQREAGDAGEFLDNLRYEMAHSEIFVFTPKGDIHTLPAGSTPVDFAYAVHTEVGHKCIGAKVDG